MAITDSLRNGFRNYSILIWLAFSISLLDRLTKAWIVYGSGFRPHAYPPFGGIELIPGFLSIVHTTNPGAAWGILAGHSWLLISTAFLVLVGMVLYRRELELDKPHMQWVFGPIIAGILGNAIDRLLYGHVIDFIDVDLQFYRWPTFNVADSGIVIGGILYFWIAFRSSANKPLSQADT